LVVKITVVVYPLTQANCKAYWLLICESITKYRLQNGNPRGDLGAIIGGKNKNHEFG
jgi:hypothetical protein